MFSVAVDYERCKNMLIDKEEVTLRGYLRGTYAPPELQVVKLPVNAIAFASCPTSRDIYFEYVLNCKRRPSWPRYVGRVIDRLYKELFKRSRAYCQCTSTSDFKIYEHLIDKSEEICKSVIRSCKEHLSSIDPPPDDTLKNKLNKDLLKIIRYEAGQISALMESELARVLHSTPDTVFTQFFSFNVDARLRTLRHGFTSPATPDFILRDRVIGDVKSGPWEDYFDFTVVAYALAYESHHNEKMDIGCVLQVEVLDSHPFPTHFGARLDLLDDHMRKRFLVIRDHKLQIVKNKIDPGPPEKPAKYCDKCDFREKCLEE